MAIDKVVDSSQLDTAMTATANAIRTQGGTNAKITWDQTKGFADAIAALSNITLESIEIVTPPGKTQYAVGEDLDTTGAVLKATYSNGATRTLTSGWTATFEGGTAQCLLYSGGVEFSLSEGGRTRTCTQGITVTNPISISATVETARAVSSDRTLRAVTYYDGRYIMIETTAAEQLYYFSFLKDSPTSLAAGSIRADRPYPVSCVAADGTYVYVGVTLGRGTTPYSNRYLLKIPYADFLAGSFSYNYWNEEGTSIEAVSGLDATNGYFTIVGSKNGVGSIGRIIPTSGSSLFNSYSTLSPITDVYTAGAGVVFIAEDDKKVGYAADTSTYSTKWNDQSSATMPPLKVAASGTEGIVLTSMAAAGYPGYGARRLFVSSGSPTLAGSNPGVSVLPEGTEILGMEAVGDYFVVASKATDGTMLLTVMQGVGGIADFRSFQTDIADPVALCKTSDGVTVIGQANGKYTITQLTVA